MSLLHFFAVTKEMVVGSAISGILYNLLPKVIITARSLDSYTACRFHKYGWPNNTSETSRGSMSHNTSSVKGLMFDVVGKATLLADVEVPYLVQPPNGVWLWVCCGQQAQPFHELY
jgi:hypothetical protein